MSFAADYHIHSSVSPDSKESYQAIFQAAGQQGLSEIMITEHYECYTPGYQSRFFQEGYLEGYADAFQNARQQYQGPLYIGFGLELGQSNENPERGEAALNSFDFDFVIGSCHKIDNMDLSQYDYNNIDTNELLDRYLKSLLEITKQDRYDCLGHFDLPKRYARRQGTDLEIDPADPRVEEILRLVIQNGKGIEINTSGLRQGAGDCFPSLPLLKRYRELGGTIVTIGSDAHRAVDVAADLKAAREILLAAGFQRTARFRNRRPELMEL